MTDPKIELENIDPVKGPQRSLNISRFEYSPTKGSSCNYMLLNPLNIFRNPDQPAPHHQSRVLVRSQLVFE